VYGGKVAPSSRAPAGNRDDAGRVEPGAQGGFARAVNDTRGSNMRRKSLVIVGAGAALLALTACGPSVAGSAAPAGGASGAASQGQAQGGSDTKVSTVAELGSLVQHNASAKNAVHIDMNMTMNSTDVTASGDMKFAGSQSAMQLNMTIPGAGSMEMVLVDGVEYMKLPAGMAPGGKPWVKLDLSSGNPASAALGSSAAMTQQADPSTLIDKIKSAGTIKSVTQEQLNGQDTTHYSITVDPKKMAADMGATDTEKQALGQLNVGSMPFDVWVDSNNLPVKITSKTATSVAGAGAIEATVTVNYTKWGEQVNVQAPPADQVGTLGG
jgi:hypothetical protein